MGGPDSSRTGSGSSGRAVTRSRLDTQSTRSVSGIPFTQIRDDKRGEGQASRPPDDNQTFRSTYIEDPTNGIAEHGYRWVGIDSHTAYYAQLAEQHVRGHLDGVLRSNLFAERSFAADFMLQERRRHEHRHPRPAVLHAHPGGGATAYNAPYFDATDPENRNNRQITGSLSYSFQRAGQHDVKGG